MRNGKLKRSPKYNKVENNSMADLNLTDELYGQEFDYSALGQEEKNLHLILVLAEKNKTINELKTKLNNLECLVESLMKQNQNQRVEQRKLIHMFSKTKTQLSLIQVENKNLKFDLEICRASYQRKERYQYYMDNTSDICTFYRKNGYCKKYDRCKYFHPGKEREGSVPVSPFLCSPPHTTQLRKKWRPQRAPPDSWRARQCLPSLN